MKRSRTTTTMAAESDRQAQPLSTEVLVVGGGIAGLAAARELVRAGVKMQVLEARNRIGGRIFTVQAPGWNRPVELGAEFLHGAPESIEGLCKVALVEREFVEQRHWWATAGQLRPDHELWDRFDRLARKIGPWFPGSLAEWLAGPGVTLRDEDKRLLRQMVTGFHAADPERMSARTLFAAAGGDEKQERIINGYARVGQELYRQIIREGGQVLLNRPVDTVKWSGGRVEVSSGAAAERRTARIVVIALPLGVLQAKPSEPGAVVFDPPLHERRQQWRLLGWGHVQRVVLRFKTPWWEDAVFPEALRERAGQGFGFVHGEQVEFPVWWAHAPEPVLVGWWGGPSARLAGPTLGDGEVLRHALHALGAMVGAPAAALEQRLADWRWHNWSRDPYSLGAYSFAAAGAELTGEAAGEPVADTLFFAGEAFAEAVDVGTVHGALETGREAGRRAAEAVRLLTNSRAGSRLARGNA